MHALARGLFLLCDFVRQAMVESWYEAWYVYKGLWDLAGTSWQSGPFPQVA